MSEASSFVSNFILLTSLRTIEVIISWIRSSSGALRLALVIGGLAFAVGMWAGRKTVSQPVEATTTSISHDVKTQQATEEQHKVIVTETTKPDGTVVKKTETDENTSKVLTKDDDHVEVKTVTETVKTKYALGLDYLPSLYTPPSMKDVRVEGSAKLGDTGLWGTVGYDVKYAQFSIGVRYEW